MKYRKLIREAAELRKHTWWSGFPGMKGWGYELKGGTKFCSSLEEIRGT